MEPQHAWCWHAIMTSSGDHWQWEWLLQESLTMLLLLSRNHINHRGSRIQVVQNIFEMNFVSQDTNSCMLWSHLHKPSLKALACWCETLTLIDNSSCIHACLVCKDASKMSLLPNWSSLRSEGWMHAFRTLRAQTCHCDIMSAARNQLNTVAGLISSFEFFQLFFVWTLLVRTPSHWFDRSLCCRADLSMIASWMMMRFVPQTAALSTSRCWYSLSQVVNPK